MKKRVTRVFSLILAVIMVFGMSTWAFALDAPKTPPTSGIGGGAAAIAARGNSLPYTGYYKQTFAGLTGANAALNGREVMVYIPEDARLREYFAVIALPSNTDIDKFLVDSGWIDIADANNLGLIIAVPGNGGTWGSQDAEAAYMTYIVSGAGGARTWYSTINEYYLVGYGDGGDLLQQYAAANPMYVISQAYFDSTVDADALLVHGNKYYRQENNESSSTTDTAAEGVSTFAPVQKKAIPVPSLLIGADMDSSAVDYWLAANECTAAADSEAGPLGSDLYTQVKDRAIATSFSDVVAYTAVLEEEINYVSPAASEEIYAFLSQYTRYDVSSAFGNALGWRLPVDEYDRVRLVQEAGGTTYNREYLIYTPEKAKDKALYPDGAPILYIFTGMTQPNNLFFDSSQWYDVARTYGFTIVVPCATTQSNAINTAWSQSGVGFTRDEAFVKMVMADIGEKYGQYIDSDRVFITGQSQGGGFVFFLAAANPDLFTAVSYTSAQGVSTSASISGEVPPVYFIYGEHDTQSPNNSRTRWLSWHGLDANDGVAYETGLPQAKDNDIGYIVAPNSSEYPGTRYAKTSWFKDEVPVVNYVNCLGRSHNNIVSDSWLLWKDWFSKWDRDESGNRVYRDVPPAVAPLKVTTEAYHVKAGDYFTLNASFTEKTSSNAVILRYSFDGDLFEYANYSTPEGVTVVNTEYAAGSAKITLIAPDYNAENLGDIMLRAKEDANLTRGWNTVALTGEYVVKNEAGDKEIQTAAASVSFTTVGDGTGGPGVPGDTNDDGVVDLIDLSNIIDWFGTDETDPAWESLYTFFDFNNNGEIDIYDISYVAKLLQ